VRAPQPSRSSGGAASATAACAMSCAPRARAHPAARSFPTRPTPAPGLSAGHHADGADACDRVGHRQCLALLWPTPATARRRAAVPRCVPSRREARRLTRPSDGVRAAACGRVAGRRPTPVELSPIRSNRLWLLD
jgi:hypothetical protein